MTQLFIWFRKEKRLKGPLPDPGEIEETVFLRQQSEGKSDAVSGSLDEILRRLSRSERFELGQALKPVPTKKEKAK